MLMAQVIFCKLLQALENSDTDWIRKVNENLE